VPVTGPNPLRAEQTLLPIRIPWTPPVGRYLTLQAWPLPAGGIPATCKGFLKLLPKLATGNSQVNPQQSTGPFQAECRVILMRVQSNIQWKAGGECGCARDGCWRLR
jgi:hypothetical protein